MIQHPRMYTDLFTIEDVDCILESAVRILEEIGIVIQSGEARERLADAGAAIEEGTERVYLSSDFVEKHHP